MSIRLNSLAGTFSISMGAHFYHPNQEVDLIDPTMWMDVCIIPYAAGVGAGQPDHCETSYSNEF